MTNSFGFFIYLSTFFSVISMIVICVGFILETIPKRRTHIIKITDTKSLNAQINICRVASIVFTVLDWLIISCEKKTECLKGYAKLSSICSGAGVVWIVFAFFCVAVNLVLIVRKSDSGYVKGVSVFRNSAFVMGGIFILFSFVLNVK